MPLFEPLQTKLNSIDFWEFANYYTERWAPDGSEVVRGLACKWGDRQDFLPDLFGDSRKVGDKLRRDLPEEDRDFTGFFAMEGRLVEKLGYPGRDDATDALKYFDGGPPDYDAG